MITKTLMTGKRNKGNVWELIVGVHFCKHIELRMLRQGGQPRGLGQPGLCREFQAILVYISEPLSQKLKRSAGEMCPWIKTLAT